MTGNGNLVIMIYQIYESDDKIIKTLKKICSFDYEIENNFCTKISFYNENEIFGSTIRKNTNKDIIINLISKFSNLKHLNLKKCRINKIPNFVSNNLEHIDLSCNNLIEFPEWILKQSKLKFLNLGANFIESVPDLSHLCLESIKLHKNKIRKIPKINENCKSLNLYLNTEINEYTVNLANLINLETFCFGFSKTKNMPPISNWKNLKWLTITINNLSDIDDEICNLKNLEGLQLSKNCIEKLPELIGETSIKYLTLYSNKIKKIPESFYNLNLQKLNMYKNPLRQKDKNKLIEKYKNIEFFRI